MLENIIYALFLGIPIIFMLAVAAALLRRRAQAKSFEDI